MLQYSILLSINNNYLCIDIQDIFNIYLKDLLDVLKKENELEKEGNGKSNYINQV